jgi:hypothetical protein
LFGKVMMLVKCGLLEGRECMAAALKQNVQTNIWTKKDDVTDQFRILQNEGFSIVSSAGHLMWGQ